MSKNNIPYLLLSYRNSTKPAVNKQNKNTKNLK